MIRSCSRFFKTNNFNWLTDLVFVIMCSVKFNISKNSQNFETFFFVKLNYMILLSNVHTNCLLFFYMTSFTGCCLNAKRNKRHNLFAFTKKMKHAEYRYIHLRIVHYVKQHLSYTLSKKKRRVYFFFTCFCHRKK